MAKNFNTEFDFDKEFTYEERAEIVKLTKSIADVAIELTSVVATSIDFGKERIKNTNSTVCYYKSIINQEFEKIQKIIEKRAELMKKIEMEKKQNGN